MLILNILNFLRTITILFFISVLGLILNRKNILITLISLELILLAININFTFFSIHLDDISFLCGMLINYEKPIRKEISRIIIIDWKIDLSKKIIEMLKETITYAINSFEKDYNLIPEFKKLFNLIPELNRLQWGNERTLQKLIKDKSVEIELIKVEISIINTKMEKFTIFIEILTEELNALKKANPTISSNHNSDYSEIYRQNVKYKNRLTSLKIDANYLENYLENNPLIYISRRQQSNLIYLKMTELQLAILNLKIQEYKKILNFLNKQIACHENSYYLEELKYIKLNHKKQLIKYENDRDEKLLNQQK